VSLAIDKAKKGLPVDPSRIYLLGVGTGAKFATLFAFKNPDLVKGVIAANFYWNRYTYADSLPKAKEAGLAVCLIQGKESPSFHRTQDGEKQLTDAGVKAKLVGYDGWVKGKLPDNFVDLVGIAIGWMMG